MAEWNSKGPKIMNGCRLSSEVPDKQCSAQYSKTSVGMCTEMLPIASCFPNQQYQIYGLFHCILHYRKTVRQGDRNCKWNLNGNMEYLSFLSNLLNPRERSIAITQLDYGCANWPHTTQLYKFFRNILKSWICFWESVFQLFLQKVNQCLM